MRVFAILTGLSTGSVVAFEVADLPLDASWIDIEEMYPKPQLGYFYDGTKFIPKKIPEKLVNLDDFIDRLNDDEYELYLDVDSYDKKATKDEKQKSVKIKRKREAIEKMGAINTSTFIEESRVFVEEGIVTQTRFDEILADMT